MPMCDNHGNACGTRGMSFCTMIHEPTASEIATFEAALLVPSESGEAQLEGAAGEAGVGVVKVVVKLVKQVVKQVLLLKVVVRQVKQLLVLKVVVKLVMMQVSRRLRHRSE